MRHHTPLREVARTLFTVYRQRSLVGLALMIAQAFFYNAIFFTFALVGRLPLACFKLSHPLTFSLLRRLPFARFLLAHALTFAPLFSQALRRARTPDAFLDARIVAWIVHLSRNDFKQRLSVGCLRGSSN